MAKGDGPAERAGQRWRFLLLWLAGIDLRLTILALPPVLPLIHRDLGLDEKTVAALTGLPVLLFGLVAVPGSLLIARIGARRAAIAGMLMIAIASALRGVGPSVAMLFFMTLVMGAGVSILQPALPALVSRWFAARAGLATAVYANGLLIGEVLGAGLTIPLILPLVGGSWEASFAVWGAPVLVTAAMMLLGTPHDPPGKSAAARRWSPDWHDFRTWQLGLIQGGGSALYFSCNAFLPDYLHAIGRPELVNACLTALNGGQVPASFVILALAQRLTGRKGPFIAAALVGLASLGGLLVPIPAVMVASAGIAGCAAAFVLILTLALPPLLAPEAVHRLAAGMLAIGYTLTFIVPFIGGAIWDATAVTATAFLPGAVGSLIVMAMAFSFSPVQLAEPRISPQRRQDFRVPARPADRE
jgi:CP family cyanate transporter-like MFS transporter